MDRFLVLVILASFVSPALQAQIKDTSDDSISTYLCKTWVEKARFLCGTQIQSFGATLTYSFNTNSSFTKSIGTTVEQGTWSYNSSKKVVALHLDRKVNFYVVHLNNSELLFSSDLEEGAKKGLGILVLFQPKKE